MRLTSLGLLIGTTLLLGSGCNNTDTGTDGGGFSFDLAGDLRRTRPASDLLPPPDMASFCSSGNIDAGCPPTDPGGPTVTIVAPTTNAVAAGNLVTVTASVTLQPLERFIDHVEVYLVGDRATVTRMSLTNAADQYTADFDLTGYPTESLTLAVTAYDLDGKRGSAEVGIVRDAGPLITVYQPKAGASYRGSAPVLFTVVNPTVDPTFDPDPNTVQAQVQGVNITLQPDATQPVWTGTIDFHDMRFGQVLTGNQVLNVYAKDKNNPPTQAHVQVPFTVDETGPTITFLDPIAGQIVGGVMTIQAQVDDPSGVDPNSVFAVFGGNGNNTKFQVQLFSTAMVGMMSSDVYQGQFDTNQLAAIFVSPNISVRANDKLGNSSEAAIQVNLDNVPPAIDLDPPEDFRSFNIISHQKVCSEAYDPVGADATNDGSIQEQLAWFRARIEDRGNIAPSTTPSVDWLSLVDRSSVELFLIPSMNGPLIVDTDGDGICDDINPKLIPSTAVTQSNEALTIALAPIPVGGVLNFDVQFPPANGYPNCDAFGIPMALPPDPLCGVSPITYDLGYTSTHMEPAIWTVPPVISPPSIACEGVKFDAANNLPDGPLCVAVRAYDKIGNRNVSKPLRICLDKSGNSGVCTAPYQKGDPPKNATGLPNCTGLVDKNGVVHGFDTDGVSSCRAGVKYNDGSFTVAFPDPLPAYQQ